MPRAETHPSFQTLFIELLQPCQQQWLEYQPVEDPEICLNVPHEEWMSLNRLCSSQGQGNANQCNKGPTGTNSY